MRGIVLRLRPAAHRRVAADMGKSRLLNRWLIIHLRGRGFVGEADDRWSAVRQFLADA